MDPWIWLLFVLATAPLCDSWRSSSEEDRRDVREDRRGVHYHKKRHMVPNESDSKKRVSAPLRARESKKTMKTKPSGNLTPLKEDEIDNDEVVSVAIGPPPMRPIYDKPNWKVKSLKNLSLQTGAETSRESSYTNMVKDILTQIGREFLTHQVNEDFVFGQYVGLAMKNITGDQKLKFQHDILELVIKHQKISRGEPVTTRSDDRKDTMSMFKEMPKISIKHTFNDTDEWSDFNNLAKLVG